MTNLINEYEKYSGMKAPTTPAVEERRADSMNVFFRPDDDDGEDDDGDVGHKDDDDDFMSPILSASQPQPKLPIIRPTM